MITVTSINIFPIKACAGVSVRTASLDRYGIVGDRRFLVVDQDGVALTQRDCGALREVRPQIMNKNELIIDAPGMNRLAVPVIESSSTVSIRIWDDACSANDCGNEIAEWFSTYLQQPCRLVCAGDNFVRQVNRTYANPGQHTAFTDGFPILLISEESLADLNSRIEHPVVMAQFRPNIVVRGCEPYGEDNWRSFQINGLRFSAVKPCARCVVTTINPQNGTTSPEPLRTLSTYRRGPSGGVMFGQNIVHRDWVGTFMVGDPLTLL